ncbi:MAG TPA: hypothetical protein VL970_06375 [Candidatus Acidoferrales bacterium]|nr:hypothetical protein [Candidatus Acidoferrales bacterium]
MNIYAGDNNDYVISCRPAQGQAYGASGQYNQHAINTDQTAGTAMVSIPLTNAIGGTPSVWECPALGAGSVSLNTSTSPEQWQIGYQYLGGIATWYNPYANFIPSASPVKLSTSKPEYTIAADPVLYIPGAGWQGEITGKIIHQRGGTVFPDGGNQATIGGSVQWHKFEDLYLYTTYDYGNSSSGRFFYFYQDPSYLGAMGSPPYAANLSNLRATPNPTGSGNPPY